MILWMSGRGGINRPFLDLLTKTKFGVDTIKDDSFCFLDVLLLVDTPHVITIHKLELNVCFVILGLNLPNIARVCDKRE